jgi:primosomal protein N' (replication factor Y)
MLASVLTSAASWHSESPFLTYLVPFELQDTLREGQLVAVPYGERLVEGIIWHIHQNNDEEDFALRPLAAILDTEPALLPHQRGLAEWMAEYYVTPLSTIALMMLPPGLMQRSQVVLKLADDTAKNEEDTDQPASLRLRALIGLLLSDGELDVEQLKKMLGPKRTKELLQEASASGLVEREAQLTPPRAKKRVQRVVRLVATGELLSEWRERREEQVRLSKAKATEAAPVPLAPDHVRRRPMKHLPDPWAIHQVADAMTLMPQDTAGLLAQRQLAAIELLEEKGYKPGDRSYWSPNKLCKASKLTPAQLHALVSEQLIAIEEIEVQRDPLHGRVFPPSSPLALTTEQQQALAAILASVKQPEQPLLLHGVTGSGKTEVYLQALAAIIQQGKRGLVLVPEIALTTQAVARVAGRFPGRVAIIHGDLYVGERYDEWRRIRSGQVDVVIGARSALFSPIPNLGMIILDEEHEPAYKQAEFRPTYHARECAIRLGQILHAPVILGSATPSIESFYRAEQGAYRLVELPHRIGSALPPVEVIDLRNELHAGNTSILSRRLQSELERVLQMKQQAILFLNRRGAASCVLCRECGFVAMCDRCDMPLTYHSTERILLCHYCNRQARVLYTCPQCQSTGIRYYPAPLSFGSLATLGPRHRQQSSCSPGTTRPLRQS